MERRSCRWLVNVIRLGVCLGAGFALPSCSNDLPSISGIMAPPPSPLQSPAPPSTVRYSGSVSVGLLSGPPEGVADRLTRKLNASCERANLALMKFDGPTADLRLQGYFTAVREANKVELVYIWDVFDSSGNRRGRAAGSEKIALQSGNVSAWEAVTDDLLGIVADRGVREIEAHVGTRLGAGLPVR